MFLSVVDAPSGNGPLALRAEGANAMFKRRYNVAASRARGQMWVVHSLDARVDLQAGDLRRRLIEHAEDPQALMRLIELGEQNTESEFERMVLRRLINAGYQVTPQWPVGYYRIDLVVESDGKQAAIECDGDRYHPPEKLTEDLGRQAILERLGWTFLRIRGSQFFRDPELAMQSVFVQLESIGIRPQSGGGPDQDAIPQESELRDRVAQRAAEIRREWEIGSDEPSDWFQQGVKGGTARRGWLNPVVRPTQTSRHSTPDVAEESNSIGESNEVKTVVPIGRTAGEQAQNVPSGVSDVLVENPEEVVVPGQTAWHPKSNEGRPEPQQTSIELSENEARRKLINLRESTIRQKYGQTAPEKGILRRNMLNALLALKPTSHEEFIAKIPHSLRFNTDQDQLDEYLNSILEIIRQIADNVDSS